MITRSGKELKFVENKTVEDYFETTRLKLFHNFTGSLSGKTFVINTSRQNFQILFLTLTRIEVVKRKPYLLQNPGSEIPETFLGRTAYSNQNLKYCIGGSCSKADQFVSLAGTSLSSL